MHGETVKNDYNVLGWPCGTYAKQDKSVQNFI